MDEMVVVSGLISIGGNPSRLSHPDRLDDVLEEAARADAEDHVKARCQLVPEPGQLLRGEFFPEENDGGADDAAAIVAPRGNWQFGVVWRRGPTAAPGALKIMKVPMHIQDVLGAGPLVQAVNILSEDPDGVEVLVHLRDDAMAAVRARRVGCFSPVRGDNAR